MPAPNRWRTPQFRRSTAASTSAPPKIWPSFFADNSISSTHPRAGAETQVQSIDPELPVFHAVTLDSVLTDSLSVKRFSMEMVALFAATALLLAGLGIYGTISYVVNEQRSEIAIRLALGAQSRHYPSMMILRRGLGLCCRWRRAGYGRRIDCVAPDARDCSTASRPTISSHLYRPHRCPRHRGALRPAMSPARQRQRVDPIVALREG